MAYQTRDVERKPQSIKGVLLRIALIVLPAPILYRFIYYSTRRVPGSPIEKGKEGRAVPLQEGVELVVLWSYAPNVGSGPMASLYVLGEEVLRLDCFGGAAGHMHINPRQQRSVGLVVARVLFPPGNRADHVDRAVFELVANTDAALKSNRLRRIRNFRIDEEVLVAASEQMKDYMMELLDRHASSTS